MTAGAADGPLARYTRVAEASAARVIAGYSTSFGLSTRLLAPRCRTGITSVYALVRVADEIVDGVGAAAGLTTAEQRAALDDLEAEVVRATATGFSTNLVVHAFAVTARAAGIDEEVTAPFFASMAMDLDPRALDPDEQAVYVHGSAEVIGLMCLRVFLAGQRVTAERRARLEESARALGAAFQNVNFLRDLAEDTARGRDYLPSTTDSDDDDRDVAPAAGGDGDVPAPLAGAGSESATGARSEPGPEPRPRGGHLPGDLPDGPLDEAGKDAWVERVRADIAIARAGIPLLPRDCRAGVGSACALFADLNDRIAATPVAELRRRRVSVPTPVKARLVASVLLKEAPWRA